jgi:hypothetical protein
MSTPSYWHGYDSQRAAISRILRSAGAQAKLTIGAPDDIYEQEADRVADEVMRMPEPGRQTAPTCNAAPCPQVEEETIQSKPLSDQITPRVQRQNEEEEAEELLQAKNVVGRTPEVTANLAAEIAAMQGRGRPLPEVERAFFEPRFGHDFSPVRIHTGAQAAEAARAVNAKAFTVGTDVVLGGNKYAPESGLARRLLAHELTHVVQQNGSQLHPAEGGDGAARVMGRSAITLARRPLEGGAADSEDLDPAADAAALLEAFQGPMTTEEIILSVLNRPVDHVRAVAEIYDRDYNIHTGEGLVSDLRYELTGAFEDPELWTLVIGQLIRAGIAVPGAGVTYTETSDSDYEIEATPDDVAAVPGTQVRYTAKARIASAYAEGSGVLFRWYVLHDSETYEDFGAEPLVIGPERTAESSHIWSIPGRHKVILRVDLELRNVMDPPPVLVEYEQVVVPTIEVMNAAWEQAGAQDPMARLDIMRRYREILVAADAQEDSGDLDAKVLQQIDQLIAALESRLASYEYDERFSMKAVHLATETATTSQLDLTLVPLGERWTGSTDNSTDHGWVLLDLTNPIDPRLTGEYEGWGATNLEAILDAIGRWDAANRYPTGVVHLEVDTGAYGVAFGKRIETDGSSLWDSVADFFNQVGVFTGVGALLLAGATAILPIPGSRFVSLLIWTSLITSSLGVGISLAQRHYEGVQDPAQDVLDVLTIAGNILAGIWLSGAKALLPTASGQKIAKGTLIGQFATDGGQGIILAAEYADQYDAVMAIQSPQKRTDALLELLRSASVAGTLVFVSIRSTRADLESVGLKGTELDAKRLADSGAVVDTREIELAPGAGRAITSEELPRTVGTEVEGVVRPSLAGRALISLGFVQRGGALARRDVAIRLRRFLEGQPGVSVSMKTETLYRVGDTHVVVHELGGISYEWKVAPDSSVGQVGTSDVGVEIVSPILRTTDDQDLFLRAVSDLKAAGMASDATTAGVHVHVGLPDIKAHEIIRIGGVFSRIEGQLAEMFSFANQTERAKFAGATREDFEHVEAAFLGSSKKTLGEIVSSVVTKFDQDEFYMLVGERYRMLNWQSYKRHGTVEFRLFNSTLNEDGLRLMQDFSSRLVAALQSPESPLFRYLKEIDAQSVDIEDLLGVLGLEARGGMGDVLRALQDELTADMAASAARQPRATQTFDSGAGMENVLILVGLALVSGGVAYAVLAAGQKPANNPPEVESGEAD